MFPTAVAYGIPGLRWRWVRTTRFFRLWFALRGCEGKLLRLPFLERKPSFAFTPLFRAVSCRDFLPIEKPIEELL